MVSALPTISIIAVGDTLTFHFTRSTFNLIGSGGLALDTTSEVSETLSTAKYLPANGFQLTVER